MPDTKISGLTDGDAGIASTDQIPINRAGTNYRVTVGAIRTLPAGWITGSMIAALTITGSLIANGTITFGKIQDVTAPVVIGRGTAGTGSLETLTPATGISVTAGSIAPGNDLAAVEGLAGTGLATRTASETWTTRSVTGDSSITVTNGDGVAGNPALSRAALTGDVTASAGTNATTIAAGVVSNSKLANMATQTFKGRTTAGTGSPEDLTTAQATALLNQFTSLLQGVVPASGGGTTNFLRADGTWTAPAGGGSVTSVGTGAGLSGGPITTTGTIDLKLNASGGLVKNLGAGTDELGIGSAGVTSAMLRNSAALSVIGRSANSSGVPDDVTATAASDAVLRESGGTIGFGTIATGGIANSAVTYAKIQDVSAASKLLGRGSAAGAGVTQEITLGTNLSMSGTTLNASGGGTTSPLTTKGDVWGFSTVDARIPIGANGTVLTADSAQALGLKWATVTASAAGSGGQVQYNTAGSLDAEAGFSYDATNNILTTPGLTNNGALVPGGIISPTSLSTDQNDYAPTNFATNTLVRLAATAPVTITGLSATGVTSGTVKILLNTTAFPVNLIPESSLSTAANRFSFPGSGDIMLDRSEAIIVYYDGTDSRWKRVCCGDTRYRDYDPTKRALILEDFFGGASSTFNYTWSLNASGTGVSAQVGTYGIDSTNKAMGVCQIDTGTTATGRGTYFCGGTTGDTLTPGQGTCFVVMRVAVESLSTGTEEYAFRVGLGVGTGAGKTANGVYWEYDRAATGDFWNTVTRASSAETRTTTSRAVDTNYLWLGFLCDATWANVYWFSATTLSSAKWTYHTSHTANIPTANIGPFVRLEKSIGTTQRNIDLDVFFMSYDVNR